MYKVLKLSSFKIGGYASLKDKQPQGKYVRLEVKRSKVSWS